MDDSSTGASRDSALVTAARQRDPAADGRIYFGRTKTGEYCRPVCPRRMPAMAHCVWFRHPSAAEAAGFLPCARCRPELAPGDLHAGAGSELARLALRRIEDGALETGDEDALAAEFGVSGTTLRATLVDAFGVGADDLASTRRLHDALLLLRDTTLPVAAIARAAGYGDARRLRREFHRACATTPSAWRKASGGNPRGGVDTTLEFRLGYRPPLNWRTLLAFLGERAIPGVETSVDGSYARTVSVGGHAGWFSVRPCDSVPHTLAVSMAPELAPVCTGVLSRIKTVFDTRASAVEIDRQLGRDPLLAETIARHGGMRLPGAFDGFELLLRAILGQQVSVRGATTLAGRMAAAFGEPLATPLPQLARLSPEPGRIADAPLGEIARIGMPGKRAQTIIHVARAVADGELRLVPGADFARVRQQLIAVPGIGEWTASYVAMRALAWSDALPVGDLGVKKALGMTRAADILERTETWRPWRAYGAIYLWLSLGGG